MCPHKFIQVPTGVEYASDARSLGGFYVSLSVTEEDGSVFGDVVFLQGLENHPWFWFPAVAHLVVFLDFGTGQMGTVEKFGDVPTISSQFFIDFSVELLHVFFGIVAPGDAALVGHHEQKPAFLGKSGYGFSGPFDPVKVLFVMHISVIAVEHPIAVKENRFHCMVFHAFHSMSSMSWQMMWAHSMCIS